MVDEDDDVDDVDDVCLKHVYLKATVRFNLQIKHILSFFDISHNEEKPSTYVYFYNKIMNIQ